MIGSAVGRKGGERLCRPRNRREQKGLLRRTRWTDPRNSQPNSTFKCQSIVIINCLELWIFS